MNANRLNSIQPTPGIAGTPAYSVPKHGAPVDLYLDKNEGEAPSPELLQRILEVGPDVMRRYPSATELEAMLAKRFSVSPAEILVTAGADDALDRICRAFIAPGRRLLTTNPTFEMLPRYARIMGGDVDQVEWWSDGFPVADFAAAARPNTVIAAVVSPNNPTGTVATRDELQRVSATIPQAVLLLDHAYVEFADEDLTDFARTLPNTIIVRTLSKAWGLAGLRVGYAIGPEDFIRYLRTSGSPYSVSRPSIALAVARLEKDTGESQRFIQQVRRDRDKLHQTLAELDVRHTESHGNFAFATSPRALWIRDALAGLGIAIRVYTGDPSLGDSMRITLSGNAGDSDRLCRAMRAALKPQALVINPAGFADTEITRLTAMARKKDLALVKSVDVGDWIPGWMICRTKKEIGTAREKELVPVCLRTERGSTGLAATELIGAGAACVLEDFRELEGLLP